jgi:hypothetical protein
MSTPIYHPPHFERIWDDRSDLRSAVPRWLRSTPWYHLRGQARSAYAINMTEASVLFMEVLTTLADGEIIPWWIWGTILSVCMSLDRTCNDDLRLVPASHPDLISEWIDIISDCQIDLLSQRERPLHGSRLIPYPNHRGHVLPLPQWASTYYLIGPVISTNMIYSHSEPRC